MLYTTYLTWWRRWRFEVPAGDVPDVSDGGDHADGVARRAVVLAAIPDLSDPDDRVTAVRDRATRLRRRRSILAGAAVLVIAALPFVLRGGPAEPVTLGAVPACPAYTRMVFEYPDGSDRAVDFAMNCGTVESGDVVRSGDITQALDEFAESYRAQGRRLPRSPVEVVIRTPGDRLDGVRVNFPDERC